MISYQVEREIDPAAVADLFRRSGIRRPVEDLDRIGRMIEHANLILCAWDGEKIVGIARALTDFSYCCYLRSRRRPRLSKAGNRERIGGAGERDRWR